MIFNDDPIFRTKGHFYPFREIYLAVESLSPKMGPKNAQSQDEYNHLTDHDLLIRMQNS